MKKTILASMVIVVTILGAILPAAQPAARDKAYTLAQNWIAAIIDKKGDWGKSPDATMETVFEFKSGEKTVDYLCTESLTLKYRIGPTCRTTSLPRRRLPYRAQWQNFPLTVGVLGRGNGLRLLNEAQSVCKDMERRSRS